MITRKITKKGTYTLLILLVILGCWIILMAVLYLLSPGKTKPFLDGNGKLLEGSISEKVKMKINGIEQGMFIKGKNIKNPVLLYLHGGMPDYFLTRKYLTGMEDYFTVVWWEMRGSGMSYNIDIPVETKNLDQMISDAKEVTNYLRQRFGQEKIYLMGRSGGTFIGIQMIDRMPELYNAYIGVAQISYQLQSEMLAYDYMLKRYRENGNKKMVKKLEASPVTMTEGVPQSYHLIRDVAMHDLGIGTTHDMRSVLREIILPSFTCPDYTLTEKINLWKAKASSGISILWSKIVVTDLSKEFTEFKIPVYFFHGVYDYTVNYELAKEYYQKIKAPAKKFFTFEKSAHSPLFEEPQKMRKIFEREIFPDVITK